MKTSHFILAVTAAFLIILDLYVEIERMNDRLSIVEIELLDK